MKTRNFVILMMALPLVLAACSSNQTTSTAHSEESVAEATFAEETMVPETENIPNDMETKLRDDRLVFFEFDQDTLIEEAKSLISSHAEYLSSSQSIRVRLEGHADERGTREYNMALAERRAEAVRQALIAQGISPDRIEIVSYGEELPAVRPTRINDTYAKNRRVEFHYLDGLLASAPLSYEADNIAESNSYQDPPTAAGPSN